MIRGRWEVIPTTLQVLAVALGTTRTPLDRGKSIFDQDNVLVAVWHGFLLGTPRSAVATS